MVTVCYSFCTMFPILTSPTSEEKHLRKLKHFMKQVDAMPWKFSSDLQQERDPEEDAEITVPGLKLIGLFAGSVPQSILEFL